ncbi:MAG: hypothetical protein R3F30_14200 [Planctomycetota bacterium]
MGTRPGFAVLSLGVIVIASAVVIRLDGTERREPRPRLVLRERVVDGDLKVLGKPPQHCGPVRRSTFEGVVLTVADRIRDLERDCARARRRGGAQPDLVLRRLIALAAEPWAADVLDPAWAVHVAEEERELAQRVAAQRILRAGEYWTIEVGRPSLDLVNALSSRVTWFSRVGGVHPVQGPAVELVLPVLPDATPELAAASEAEAAARRGCWEALMAAFNRRPEADRREVVEGYWRTQAYVGPDKPPAPAEVLRFSERHAWLWDRPRWIGIDRDRAVFTRR